MRPLGNLTLILAGEACQKPDGTSDLFQPRGSSLFWLHVLLSLCAPQLPSFPASWDWKAAVVSPSLTSRSPQGIHLPLGSLLLHPPGTPPSLTSSPLVGTAAPQTAPAPGCCHCFAFPALSRSELCRKLHGLRVWGDGRGQKEGEFGALFCSLLKTIETDLRFYLSAAKNFGNPELTQKKSGLHGHPHHGRERSDPLSPPAPHATLVTAIISTPQHPTPYQSQGAAAGAAKVLLALHLSNPTGAKGSASALQMPPLSPLLSSSQQLPADAIMG